MSSNLLLLPLGIRQENKALAAPALPADWSLLKTMQSLGFSALA